MENKVNGAYNEPTNITYTSWFIPFFWRAVTCPLSINESLMQEKQEQHPYYLNLSKHDTDGETKHIYKIFIPSPLQKY